MGKVERERHFLGGDLWRIPPPRQSIGTRVASRHPPTHLLPGKKTRSPPRFGPPPRVWRTMVEREKRGEEVTEVAHPKRRGDHLKRCRNRAMSSASIRVKESPRYNTVRISRAAARFENKADGNAEFSVLKTKNNTSALFARQ